MCSQVICVYFYRFLSNHGSSFPCLVRCTGNFYHLPPVGPTLRTLRENTKSTQVIEGYQLWEHTLHTGVELTECKRTDSPEYATMLERFRTNQMTENDIALVNSRVISPSLQPPSSATIAVPYNKDRQALSRIKFMAYLDQFPVDADNPDDWRTRGALRVLANISASDGKHGIDPRLFPYIRNMDDMALDIRA